MLLSQISRRTFLVMAPLCGVLGAGAQSITGPSSSESPYLVRVQPGVVTVSVLTAGDAVNFKADGVTPYRMVGIPDGLGAFDNGDGTFTLLSNHELPSPAAGAVRDHGFRGAFISRWIIDKDTLTVLHGEDLIKHAYAWNTNGFYAPITNAFLRFCSADLPEISAFYDASSGLGYPGRIFMNGEETGNEGRAFAHLLDGNSFELPWLGKFSHENSVANPATGTRTVVAGLDDSGSGQVYVYVGTKTSAPDPISAAGLNNGALFGIKVAGHPKEDDTHPIPSGTPFTAYNFGDVSGKTGGQLEIDSTNNAVTAFDRPEDGCWDPSHPNDFYFVTTASFTGRSRLWRLHFSNPADPVTGGTIDMLLDGTEGYKMLDNITVTRRGDIIMQEDVGENERIGKVWRYNIASRTLQMIAEHDPNRFAPGAADFLTIDEESSGVIPMDDILGEGWLLMDVQAHFHSGDAELVEGGQFVAMHVPPGKTGK